MTGTFWDGPGLGHAGRQASPPHAVSGHSVSSQQRKKDVFCSWFSGHRPLWQGGYSGWGGFHLRWQWSSACQHSLLHLGRTGSRGRGGLNSQGLPIALRPCIRTHVLKAAQPPQRKPPARDQVFKQMDMRENLHTSHKLPA